MRFFLIKEDKVGFESQSADVAKIVTFSNKVTFMYNTITGLYAKL